MYTIVMSLEKGLRMGIFTCYTALFDALRGGLEATHSNKEDHSIQAVDRRLSIAKPFTSVCRDLKVKAMEGDFASDSVETDCMTGKESCDVPHDHSAASTNKNSDDSQCFLDSKSKKSSSIELDQTDLAQVPSLPETESVDHGSSAVDSHNLQQNSNVLQGTEHSGLEKGSEDCTEGDEVSTGTKYLDGIISSMKSLRCQQPCTDKDTVEISRTELTMMVERTLEAQKMLNSMQDLVQKNKTLNRQNEVLKDTILQTRSLEHGGCEGNSLPTPCQATRGQVFHFPGSLPQVLQDAGTLSQTDSDPQSASLQLPSQISLDGEHSLNKGVSAAGRAPHVLGAANSAASEDPFPASGASIPQNIPNEDLFAGATEYSLGPQQCEESVAGSAGMSKEHVRLLIDELEKTKRLLHKISVEGGIHPNNMQELGSLREKVQKLTDENSKLKMELDNRPQNQLLAENQELKGKLQAQKVREDDLLKRFAKLGTENKILKSKSLSQPPSLVGLQAMSHSPIQTEELHSQIASLRQQLKEAQSREDELKKHLNSKESELSARAMDLSNLQQKAHIFHQESLRKSQYNEELNKKISFLTEQNKAILQERESAAKQRLLAEAQIADQEKELNTYLDKVTQEAEKSRREQERNNYLEKILADERRRYARDEKELLDRVKTLTRQVEARSRLALSVERCRREGVPLSQECTQQLSMLTQSRRQQDSAHHAPPSSNP